MEKLTPAVSQPPARFSAESWFWGLCLMSTLVVLLPFVFLDRVSPTSIGMPTFLAVLSTAYSGARLALLATEGYKKLFSLTFWIFSYVWLGLVPLVQLSAGDYPWPGNYDDGVIAFSLLVVLVGFVAYDIGFWVGAVCYRKYRGQLVYYRLSLSKGRTYLLSLFASVTALVAMQQMGGFDAIAGATRYTLDQAADPEGPKAAQLIWETLLRVPPFIALLTTWWIWLNRRQLLPRPWQRVRHVFAFLLLLVLNAVVNNPVSLNRYYLGTIVFSFVAMSLAWNKRRSFSAWVAGLVLALVMIFPYADVFRVEGQRLTLAPITTQLTSNGDYDAFQQIANTVLFVSLDGPTFGHQLLGALFFWVPRAFWPDKPFGSGQMVAERLGYDFTNLSSPLWAEAYINAGLIGVVVILLSFGLVTSLLQQAYISSTERRDLTFIGGFVPLLAGFQFFFLRGDLQNAVAYLAPMLGCYLLAAKLIRRQASGE